LLNLQLCFVEHYQPVSKRPDRIYWTSSES